MNKTIQKLLKLTVFMFKYLSKVVFKNQWKNKNKYNKKKISQKDKKKLKEPKNHIQ